MDDNGLVRGVILTVDSDVPGPAGWDACPDLLLPLANTPLVERILVEYARAGARETIIAAGRDTSEIAALCGDGARWDMTLVYGDARDDRDDRDDRNDRVARDDRDDRNDRDAPAGQRLCRRVREMAAIAKGAPLLVTPGPSLLESRDYTSLVRSYSESQPCGIRAGRHAANSAGTSGAAAGTPGDTTGTSGAAAVDSSIYLISSRICDALENVHTRVYTMESLFDAALDEFARRGETVMDLAVEHPPFSVSTPEAYLDSNKRMLASNEGGLDPGSGSMEMALPEIMADNFSSPNVVMRPPVIVDATAELERCRIGPGVCIGPGVRIGHGAAIEHSVVMTGADIGDGASISHAVIGRNAGIENRSVLHGRADAVIVVRSR